MGSIENAFAGPAQAAPAPLAQTATISWATDSVAPRGPVRHLQGYAAFADFSAAAGAVDVAISLAALLNFLHENAPAIRADSALRDAATIYLGNVIVSLRADAHWQVIEGAETSVGNDSIQFTVTTLIERLGETENWAPQMLERVQEWADEVIAEPLPYPEIPAEAQRAARYERPTLTDNTYEAADGTVIAYGERWKDNGYTPPENSYSVTSNPERFADLHVVADALIEFLTRAYDVTVTDELRCANDLSVSGADVVRAVRLTPRDDTAAPLTFALTSFPGVVVHAGMLHDFIYPSCGCDACDETAITQVEELEQLVLGVAAGCYRERYPVGSKRGSQYVLTNPRGTGSSSGGSAVETTAPARLVAAEERLQTLPDGWQPWPGLSPFRRLPPVTAPVIGGAATDTWRGDQRQPGPRGERR